MLHRAHPLPRRRFHRGRRCCAAAPRASRGASESLLAEQARVGPAVRPVLRRRLVGGEVAVALRRPHFPQVDGRSAASRRERVRARLPVWQGAPGRGGRARNAVTPMVAARRSWRLGLHAESLRRGALRRKLGGAARGGAADSDRACALRPQLPRYRLRNEWLPVDQLWRHRVRPLAPPPASLTLLCALCALFFFPPHPKPLLSHAACHPGPLMLGSCRGRTGTRGSASLLWTAASSAPARHRRSSRWESAACRAARRGPSQRRATPPRSLGPRRRSGASGQARGSACSAPLAPSMLAAVARRS